MGALLQLLKHPLVARVAIVFFLLNLAGQSLPNTWSFYTIHRYNWSQGQIGISLAFVGICIALVQAGLIRVLVPKLGETKAVYCGIIINTIGMIGVGLASEPWMIFAATVGLALGGIGGPSLQSIASKDIPPNEQGELQGFLTSVKSNTANIGPLLMTWLFSRFASAKYVIVLPVAPIFCSALLLLV